MKKTSFACMFLLIVGLTASLCGQTNQIGLRGAAGLSKMEVIHTDGLYANSVSLAKHVWTPAGQLGFFYLYEHTDNTMLGFELDLNIVRGREKSPPVELPDGTRLPERGITRRHYYMTVPLYIGYRFRKLSAHLGLQTSFLMFGSHKEDSYVFKRNGERLTVEANEGELNMQFINSWNFGPRVGLMYHLNENLILEAHYFYGTFNKENARNLDWQFQMMAIGLRFGRTVGGR